MCRKEDACHLVPGLDKLSWIYKGFSFFFFANSSGASTNFNKYKRVFDCTNLLCGDSVVHWDIAVKPQVRSSQQRQNVHMGNFISKRHLQASALVVTWPDETVHFLAWHHPSGSNIHRKQVSKVTSVCACVCTDRLHPHECATTVTVSVGTIPPVAQCCQTMVARWGAKGGVRSEMQTWAGESNQIL